MEEANPYEAPGAAADGVSQAAHKPAVHGALAAFAVPLAVALPLYLYLTRFAGSWVVSTSLPPDHRASKLLLVYLLNLVLIGAVSFFVGSFLLWRAGVARSATGLATGLLGALSLPATAVLALEVIALLWYG
ncbi:MAG: hypothetical protein AAGB00_09475 [Planctomycetota bacterium]